MQSTRTATQVIPMIGDPIAQVATPNLWNSDFKNNNIAAMCVPIHLKPSGLSQFIDWIRHAENVPGFLSTIPHKSDLVEMCDIKRGEVEVLGFANTVRKNNDGSLECAMFDGVGMISAIQETGADFNTASVLIIGSGAAGSAIAYEALQRGAKAVFLKDFYQEAADSLAEKLGKVFPNQIIQSIETSSPTYDVIINASPLGNSPDDPLPSLLDEVSSQTVIADAVTEPSDTRFLKRAREKGLKTVSGEEMAAAQAFHMKCFLGISTS